MPRRNAQTSKAGLYSETVIPEIPRLRRMYRHPLVVYSTFITVSLFLLGSMAVASLPH